jgi:hypothetical protein
MKVKVYITLNIDPEEYAIPADEQVSEEIEDVLREYIYDIEGVEIRNIKIIQE